MDDNAQAFVLLQNHVVAFVAEHKLNAVFDEVLLNAVVDVLSFFRAHMADGAVYQLQARLNCVFSYLLDRLVVADAFDLCIGTKLKIDTIGVVYKLLRRILTDKSGQIAADLIAQGKLSV